MVGITEIAGAIGGLKAALEITKGLNAVADAVALNDAKISLQAAIIDAQGSLLAAQEAKSADARRIADLEQEIVHLKDWSAEQQRYQLHNVWRGAMAYMPKPEMRGGEPPHWLCANCFNQRRKSFLLFKGQSNSNSSYGCDACKSSMIVDYRTKPTYEAPA